MEPLSRPVPPRAPLERVIAWVGWFGIGRLVGAALATLVVVVGGYLLIRMPPPPTEASLPRATTAPIGTAGPVDPPTSETAATGAGGVPGGREIEADGPSGDDGAAVETSVVVHVAGAVATPGVYELAAGARVRDAVIAAGGPTADANWDALNLAAVVADASRVHVPMVGEPVAPTTAPATGDANTGAVGPVDVNAADLTLLETLPGVGPAIAAAIVAERERNGPFLGVDDLERVPGIGPAKLAAMRDLVTT